MFIRVIDESLERLLRATLPLPPEIGDVTFDAPSSAWSAQLSRLTVNLFLYDVTRSGHPSNAPITRQGPDGRLERRLPQPLMRLSYLVSAWAGSPRDEHQLLGDVISRLAVAPALSGEYLAGDVSSTVQLSLDEDVDNRPREIWGAVGGSVKASCTLQVTVAADSFDWEIAAPPVERIAALVAPVPDPRKP